jgi:hypothetical protein
MAGQRYGIVTIRPDIIFHSGFVVAGAQAAPSTSTLGWFPALRRKVRAHLATLTTGREIDPLVDQLVAAEAPRRTGLEYDNEVFGSRPE